MVRKIILAFIVFFILQSGNIQAQELIQEQEHTDNLNHGTKLCLYASKSFLARRYVLGPNDVINVSFLDIPELNQNNLKINHDGKVVISPIGSVNVAGITLNDLQELIEQKSKYYIKNPHVYINLSESRPFIVYVTGAVLNPGSYELSTNTEKIQYISTNKPELQIERKTPLLTNVLVAAGGLSYDADLEHIEITNNIDNSKFTVNLLELLENEKSDQDIYLASGDQIYVPKLPTPLALNMDKYRKYASATFSPRVVPVKVYGYVNRPGLVQLDPAMSLNLNSAIMAAGGYMLDSAYTPKKVFISRADTSGKLVTTVVNPMSNDLTLLPNDIVYVPEKTRPLIGKAFDYLTRVMNPVNAFASSYNNWALMFDPKRYQVIGK